MGNFFYSYSLKELTSTKGQGNIQYVTHNGQYILTMAKNNNTVVVYRISDDAIKHMNIQLQFVPYYNQHYEEQSNMMDRYSEMVVGKQGIIVYVVQSQQRTKIGKIQIQTQFNTHRVQYYQTTSHILDIEYNAKDNLLVIVNEEGYQELQTNNSIPHKDKHYNDAHNTKLFVIGQDYYCFYGIENRQLQFINNNIDIGNSTEVTDNQVHQIVVDGSIQSLHYDEKQGIFGVRTRDRKNKLSTHIIRNSQHKGLQSIQQDGLSYDKYAFHTFSVQYNTMVVIQQLNNKLQRLCSIPYSFDQKKEIIYYNLKFQRQCIDTYIQLQDRQQYGYEYRAGQVQTIYGTHLFTYDNDKLSMFQVQQEQKDQYQEYYVQDVQRFSTMRHNQLILETNGQLQLHQIQQEFNVWGLIGIIFAVVIFILLIVCYKCSKSKKQQQQQQQQSQQEKNRQTNRRLRQKKPECQSCNKSKCERKLGCGHYFHKQCLEDNGKEGLCPSCSKPYSMPSSAKLNKESQNS